MRNHPDTIHRLQKMIQELVVTSADAQAPAWTVEQFQQALVTIHVPLSDMDVRDVYQYIDQKGDGD